MRYPVSWFVLGALTAAGCASDPRPDACAGAACNDGSTRDGASTDTGARDSGGGSDARVDTGSALDEGAPDAPPPPDVVAVDAIAMDAVAMDAVATDTTTLDAVAPPDASPRDTGPLDTGARDAGPLDTGVRDTGGTTGPVTGGPCLSGAPGATAWRVRWTNSGGRATVSYEVNGLPDASRWRVTANSMTIGFTPAYTDMFLGPGGLQFDSGVFIDVEMSTVGLAAITRATLAVYGRSFSVTTSGSFSWQTFTGVGAAPRDLLSNVTPYAWYGADATAAFVPGDGRVLLRIRPGPSSNSLAVNRLELCLEAR